MSRVYHLYNIVMYTHISILTSKRNFTLIYIKAISPPCRPPSSLVVDTRVVAEHHRQGSTPVKLIVDTRGCEAPR